MKNRSDIEVMASILQSAVKKWEYKTTIMYNSCISHSQLSKYLSIALEKKLIEYSEESGRYKTTNKGMIFLDKYIQLLDLLPRISEFKVDVIGHQKINQLSIN